MSRLNRFAMRNKQQLLSPLFSNPALGIGFSVLWFSVALISLAAFLNAGPPYYGEEKELKYGTPYSELESPVGPVFALAVILTPFYVTIFCLLIGIIFTSGVIVIDSFSRVSRELAIFLTGIFCCGCLLGTFLGLGTAASYYDEGVILSAVGYGLSAVGLGFGALGLAWPVVSSALVQPHET